MPITTRKSITKINPKAKSKYIEMKTCTVCESKVLDVDDDGLCLFCVEKENIKIRIHRLEKEYTDVRKEISEIKLAIKLGEDDF